MPPILETYQLQKTYGDVHAVRDVTIAIDEGSIVGFLGPNGAGKTTTIGMILGLIHPDAGTVHIAGERITVQNPAPLAQVGSLVGAEAATVPHLSARNNLRLVANIHDIADERITDVLEIVNLTHAADRRTGEFSTGMRQRLGMAMALLPDPDLLILDEPTNGLDPAGMREVRKLLLQLAERGKTVLLSSHLLSEVEQVCSQVAVLNKGEIIAEGQVDELLGENQTVHVHVAELDHASQVLRQQNTSIDVRVTQDKLIVSGADSETVMKHLVDANITPQELHVERHNLEDLFLQLTENA